MQLQFLFLVKDVKSYTVDVVRAVTVLLGIAKYELQYGVADLLQAVPGHCALAAMLHKASASKLEILVICILSKDEVVKGERRARKQ
ncbi:hypothetical protein HII31_03868 [Pseudocercospora fuligena]|uniref:Uncharacterized protein n=1 Tax=Pseudocercospora fuligena TaxID=685502 RepID=A0A8H6RPJ4_9PEZI|nr:hypothetical protein HII31_03868 [Pseudocercospora fuligena]